MRTIDSNCKLTLESFFLRNNIFHMRTIVGVSGEGEQGLCGREVEGLYSVVSAAGHHQALRELIVGRHHAHARHKVVLATHRMTLSVSHIVPTIEQAYKSVASHYFI